MGIVAGTGGMASGRSVYAIFRARQVRHSDVHADIAKHMLASWDDTGSLFSPHFTAVMA